MSTPDPTPAPYAYERWVCSECDGEPVAEVGPNYDLRCETCGHLFATGVGGYTVLVPDEEDDDV